MKKKNLIVAGSSILLTATCLLSMGSVSTADTKNYVKVKLLEPIQHSNLPTNYENRFVPASLTQEEIDLLIKQQTR